MIVTIIALDQFVWRPLLAWSDRFKVEMVESDQPPVSWFYDLLHTSRFFLWTQVRLARMIEYFDQWMIRKAPKKPVGEESIIKWDWKSMVLYLLIGGLILYEGFRTALMLISLPLSNWTQIGTGIVVTFLRVSVSLIIALLWTIPIGVAIGTNRRVAAVLQPVCWAVYSVDVVRCRLSL